MSVPHRRGDEPVIAEHLAHVRMVFPTGVGMNRCSSWHDLSDRVFPTGVGMNRIMAMHCEH